MTDRRLFPGIQRALAAGRVFGDFPTNLTAGAEYTIILV
jgi:hypothetical protein